MEFVSKGRVRLYCDQCGASFTRKLSGLKKSRSGHRFCSLDCKNEAGRIGGIPGINKSIKTGEYADYRREFSPAELRCSRCNYQEFSVSVHIHHIDHDRTNNNKNTNLIPLCGNCHAALHNNLWKLEELFDYSSEIIYVGLYLS